MAETTPSPRRQPLWRHLLGAQLRELRHDRSETLTETARRAGVSTQYLSEIERGAKEPSSEVIAAVAGALEVTLLDLTLAVADGLRETTSAAAQGPRCMAAFALAA
jgi:transcriptional regulator with XRE-family HTH domain